jgi:Trypsin-co-occurring domain 2
VDTPLAETIEALRREFEDAISRGEGSPLRFALGPIEVEFALAVERRGGGRAGIAFWVASVGAEGATSREASHRIKFVLTPRDPSGNEVLVGDAVDERPQ